MHPTCNSVNRTHEILSSIFNIPLATGTIKNMVSRVADSLSGIYENICQRITLSDLIHCDETGASFLSRDHSP